jgi:hypothetical protein
MRDFSILAATIVALSASCFAGSYGGGTGDPNAPYLISLPDHLVELSRKPADWGRYFLVTNDIDFSEPNESNFTPIGNKTVWFSGVFDGGNHSISGFNYRSIGRDYVGLFGYTRGTPAILRNVHIVDCYVDGGTGNRVGGLVGEAFETHIENCSSSGAVISTGEYVGGLIGWLYWYSIAQGCSSSVDVYGGSSETGGLIGGSFMYCNIVNCCATGDVRGEHQVGGLIGLDNGFTAHCFATGNVELPLDVNGSGGGLIGCALGRIQTSYATGSITGGRWAGGLVGDTENARIEYCFAIGNVTSDIAGGLVGFADYYTYIRNCYAKGGVFGSENAGGLTGTLAYYSELDHCFATGMVSGERYSEKGGLSGNSVYAPTCLFDKETTGQTGTNGETTENMQRRSTYIAKGWDFTNESVIGVLDTWRMCQNGLDYPRLGWEFGSDFACPEGRGIEDLLFIADRWLDITTRTFGKYFPFGPADLTGDCEITFEDFAILSSEWRKE